MNNLADSRIFFKFYFIQRILCSRYWKTSFRDVHGSCLPLTLILESALFFLSGILAKPPFALRSKGQGLIFLIDSFLRVIADVCSHGSDLCPPFSYLVFRVLRRSTGCSHFEGNYLHDFSVSISKLLIWQAWNIEPVDSLQDWARFYCDLVDQFRGALKCSLIIQGSPLLPGELKVHQTEIPPRILELFPCIIKIPVENLRTCTF